MIPALHDARLLAGFVGCGLQRHRVREGLASRAYEYSSPLIQEELDTWLTEEVQRCTPNMEAEWNAEHRAWVRLNGTLNLHDIYQLAQNPDLPHQAQSIWSRCAADLHGQVVLIAQWETGGGFNWEALHPGGHDGLLDGSEVNLSGTTSQLHLLTLRGGLPLDQIRDLWHGEEDSHMTVTAYSNGGGSASTTNWLHPSSLWNSVAQRVHEAVTELATWLAGELQRLNDHLEDGGWAEQLHEPAVLTAEHENVSCTVEDASQLAIQAAPRSAALTPRQSAAQAIYTGRIHRRMLRLKARHRQWQARQSGLEQAPPSPGEAPATDLTQLLGWPGQEVRHARP